MTANVFFLETFFFSITLSHMLAVFSMESITLDVIPDSDSQWQAIKMYSCNKLDILAHVATVTGIRQDRQTSNCTEDFRTVKLEKDLECLRIMNISWEGGRMGFEFTFLSMLFLKCNFQ